MTGQQFIELDDNLEHGLNLISDRNMHRIMRFLYVNHGEYKIKKTMLTRFCTPNALNECLKKLESSGLITITPRKEPQNVFYIDLTPKGMLFEKADIVETCIISDKGVDPDNLSRMMEEWESKVEHMSEGNEAAQEFFRLNTLSFSF